MSDDSKTRSFCGIRPHLPFSEAEDALAKRCAEKWKPVDAEMLHRMGTDGIATLPPSCRLVEDRNVPAKPQPALAWKCFSCRRVSINPREATSGQERICPHCKQAAAVPLEQAQREAWGDS